MKYIIEFEDMPSFAEDGMAYYKCKQAPWWFVSDRLIGKLTSAQNILSEIDKIDQKVDEAYQKGINDGSLDAKQRVEGAYQKGLTDAWEAAKKIALMDTETSENVTGYFGLFRIMENLTPMQAIEKLKAYEEQKADDEIKVGDVVKWNSDLIVVTRLYEAGGFDWCGGISKDGSVFQVLAENVRKTGRHFDIDKILEAMKE